MLCAVILHTASQVEIGDSTLSALTEVVSQQDYWSIYRVVRQALRFGQYEQVPKLIGKLTDQVLKIRQVNIGVSYFLIWSYPPLYRRFKIILLGHSSEL